MRLYVLTRKATIYHREDDDTVVETKYDVVGAFSEWYKIRDMVNRLILKITAPVEENNIISESFSEVSYYTPNGDEYEIEYEVSKIDELNVEL